MSLKETLQWRYATKKMNGQPVSQEKIDKIVDAARHAPSSSGLQPYRILVISDAELKKAIFPIAMNQSQIVDCSHLVVFVVWDNYTEERVNAVFSHMNKERGLPDEATEAYKKMLLGKLLAASEQENFEHAARQAYLSLGVALVAAADEKVDATPMEGFNPDELDKHLDLRAQGLRSVALMALGYRDAANDWLAPLKKIRTPLEAFVIEHKN